MHIMHTEVNKMEKKEIKKVQERVEELEDQIVDYNRRIQRGLPASKASMSLPIPMRLTILKEQVESSISS